MQKKILALHDLAGLGRSSLVPIIGVLCAMGHQCVPVPTAVYSSHLGLPGWHGFDLTGLMRAAAAQYDALGLQFDAVYAGFLSSAEQVSLIIETAERLCAGLLIVDPVLGDNGRLYSSITPALCGDMPLLCRQADVITPNSTEAAALLGLDLSAAPCNADDACAWAFRLWKRFGASVVLTGLALQEGMLSVACCNQGETALLHHPRLGASYPGTGDLFTAVLAGGLVSGETLVSAAQRAADFVRECIAETERQTADRLQGVQFERQLWRLSEPPARQSAEYGKPVSSSHNSP